MQSSLGVSAAAPTMSFHVMYKLKASDDQYLKLKIIFASHSNQNSMLDTLKTDCSMCSPTGIHLLLSSASLCIWKLSKLYIESAFFQAGPAERYVHVIPPKESGDREKFHTVIMHGLVRTRKCQC